jgi:hypothetical protein
MRGTICLLLMHAHVASLSEPNAGGKDPTINPFLARNWGALAPAPALAYL